MLLFIKAIIIKQNLFPMENFEYFWLLLIVTDMALFSIA